MDACRVHSAAGWPGCVCVCVCVCVCMCVYACVYVCVYIYAVCGQHLHWLISLETSRHFRKIALRLGIFLPMFRGSFGVVARQLATKCRDFSKPV